MGHRPVTVPSAVGAAEISPARQGWETIGAKAPSTALALSQHVFDRCRVPNNSFRITSKRNPYFYG